jgi:hypothetical protein
VASGPGQPGPDQPEPGPRRLADSLARHRWITAAGLTATIAAVAGGGMALAFHDGAAHVTADCGLVTCAAALPVPVRSGGTGPASGAGPAGAPAKAAPVGAQRAPVPAAPPPPAASAPSSPSAGQAVSADRVIGARYEITGDTQHGIHGQIVIANNGSAPVSGWRVTVVLPGDTHYQVLNAGNRSAGDALVVAAPGNGRALAGGSTELVAFTARGTTSTPLRFTVTEAGRAAVSQPGTGRDGHHGWPGGWPDGGRFSQGGWGAGGWGAGGWGAGGWGGQQHGWPGGR